MEFLKPLANLLEVLGADRVDAAEDHRANLRVAGERFVRAVADGGDGVAVSDFLRVLDRADDIADLAGFEFADGLLIRAEDADLADLRRDAVRHEAHGVADPDGAVHDADVDDHAAEDVELRVEDERPKGGALFRLRRGNARDDGLQHLVDVQPRLRADGDVVVRGDAEEVLDLLRDALHVGAGHVHLVEDGDDLEVVVDGQIGVGDRLGLDALRRVDNEDRPFAGAHAARDLVGEVDVAGGVDEVEEVGRAVLRHVGH